MASALRAVLTRVRGVLARGIAATVERFPLLEPAFVLAGRAVRCNYPLASLYYHAHTNLTGRLRSGGNRFRRLTIEGIDADVDITDHSARLLYFQGVAYEPHTTRCLIAALSPGDVFVDVGANAGFFTTLAARRIEASGRVVAFEPHPGARDAMCALVARNGVADRVDVVGAAVGRRVAPAVTLHLTSDSVLSTLAPELSPLRGDFTFDRSIDVPLTTIDAWMDDHPALVPRIALIKIDVEGLESDVVAGMTATLAAARRTIVICETCPDSDADRQLSGLGFAREALEADARGFGNHQYRREP